MTRYERDFLVPYLRDICSLYLADRQINSIINKLEHQIRELCIVESIPELEEPDYDDEAIGCLGSLAIVGIVISAIGLLGPILTSTNMPFSYNIMYICILIPCCLIALYSKLSVNIARESNEKKRIAYEKSLEHRNNRKRQMAEDLRKRNEMTIPIQHKIMELEKERKNIQLLREKAYAVNVIPYQYRNIYAAVYLYEWFSTSGADDLDMALNMFVLEEIKAKLDRIIENQTEMILNQQIMIANQRRDSDTRRKYEIEMKRKLDHLQATEDEKLRYNRMIESNTAATAYFAAAEYFRKI